MAAGYFNIFQLQHKKYIYNIIFLLAGILVNLALYGQGDQYRFEAISVKQGLSNNRITSIFEDHRGFMWFGTSSGLNKYDGYGFKVFRNNIGDSSSLNDNFIDKIIAGPHRTMWVNTPKGWNIYDFTTEGFIPGVRQFFQSIGIPYKGLSEIIPAPQGNFYFLFPGKGVYLFNAVFEKTIFYNTKNGLYSNDVTGLTFDATGALWMIYKDGVIQKRTADGNRLLQRSNKLQQYLTNGTANYRIYCDSENELWIYASDKEQGLYWYRPISDQLLAINKNSPGLQLNNNIVNGLAQDEKQNIWVATDHGGVNVIDKRKATVTYLYSEDDYNKTISENAVNTIFKDSRNIIWLGSFKKGINYYYQSSVQFPLYTHLSKVKSSPPFDDMNCFAEDEKGNLWMGTNGDGLLHFNRYTNIYTRYTANPGTGNSISSNVITSLFLDKTDKLWIGTFFGGLNSFDGKKFIHYRHNPADPFSIADDRVWEIFEDSQNRLWIGTLRNGIELFDRNSGRFIQLKSDSIPKSITAIIEDKKGNIWIGGHKGIAVLDKNGRLFKRLVYSETGSKSISSNSVMDIAEDGTGLIWIATRKGLNVYNPANNHIITYNTEDGLPDNTVLRIIIDNNKNLWLSTPNGLSNAIVTRNADGAFSLLFRNYDETDGLQGRLFNDDAAIRTKTGELVFGGPYGFNIFYPPKPVVDKYAPKLMFTGLQVFNYNIQVGEKYDGRTILPQSISTLKEITLRHNQNAFIVEFTALDYINTSKIKYAYQLQGFSDKWFVTDGNSRKANFTGLRYGTYKLLVKTLYDQDAQAQHPIIELTIRILPPFWLTGWAYCVYILLFAGCLIYSRYRIMQNARKKFKIERERLEANRAHELNQVKIHFFTNLSHEFRTPLALIITPIEKLIKQTTQLTEKRQFQLIYRNARRLMNMVNELLDFRKLEMHELRLSKNTGDIIRFLRETGDFFSDIAEQKNIHYCFKTQIDELLMDFDANKMERVLFNLLSNAFKFTPEGGSVTLSVQYASLNDTKTVEIAVTDTGIGINKDKHEKIFERFFQTDVSGAITNTGNGIGLSITKEFVHMHGGTIRAESELNKGSRFIMLLPVIKSGSQPVELEAGSVQSDQAGTILIDKPSPEKYKTAYGTKKVLIVEDNDDYRFYIKDNLKEHFNIIEASNGKLGWQKALSEHPDLVVSDINMSEMNGIELTRKIKEDKRTYFIPVILLTVLTAEEWQIRGLQTGANDYIAKPFNIEMLLSKIRNLLAQQDNFKKTYQKQVQVSVSDVAVEAAEDAFVKQALAFVEKRIADADLSVNEMSRELLMSRAALYKKIFLLTGQTPAEFIRSIRLQRAIQLLEKSQLTVTEIAYAVGFTTPKYFSRLFKETYNITPSAYLQEKRKSDKANI